MITTQNSSAPTNHALPQKENFSDINFALEQRLRKRRNEGGAALSAWLSGQAANYRRAIRLNLIVEESVELKNRILELHKTSGLQTVAFAGATRGAGGSTVVMKLAETFAQTETHRVLVIDANFKSLGISNYLGARGFGKGLLDVLENPSEMEGVLQKAPGVPLYFMPHGRKRRHPEQLLNLSIVMRLISAVENLFDFVFIDTPPLRDFSDGFLWGQIADGMIVVSHPQHTKMDDVRFVQKTAQRKTIEIIGNVITRRRNFVPMLSHE